MGSGHCRRSGRRVGGPGCARRLRPQVAIVDLQMPGLHGLEVTRAIARELPDTGVLVLTMSEDDATGTALRAGARGYLLKNAGEEGIIRAVRAVAEGELAIGPGIARRVLGFFSRPAPSPAGEAFPELTQRERDVLDLLAQGLANAAIAARLGLTAKTVRNYVSTILMKLQVADRARRSERPATRGSAARGTDPAHGRCGGRP